MHCEYGFWAWPCISRRWRGHFFGGWHTEKGGPTPRNPSRPRFIGWLAHLMGRDDGWVPGLLAIVDAFFASVFEELQPGADAAVRASQRADLQVDGVLALARALGRPPRDVAEEVVARAMELGLGELCEKVEVAGPGFINLTLAGEFLASELRDMLLDPARLDVQLASPSKKVVVDYAAPNVAKPMHVGHLRSTIIGDCLVRLLEFVGHNVIKENHVGDWGTPFGMLIEHLVDIGEDEAVSELAVGDLELFYQQARAAYDSDPAFAERASERVVLLQSGDPETLELWRLLVNQSLSYFDDILARLGTKLTRDDVVGESYYNPLLPAVVDDLAKMGLLVQSEGAQCVFPPGYTNREGDPLPLIVQKSDGGYTYATTDLAAVRDRVGRLGAELLVYVVGSPQSEHFEMVFATARLAHWLPEGAQAVHVGFGNVLGPDGKMFRTRQGATIKLAELLDEATERARALMVARAEQIGQPVEGDLEGIARAVGIGAVKYADLSTDRARDYRFDWDRMLAFDGNTAPYIQYAHARVRSILRRAAGPGTAGTAGPVDEPGRNSGAGRGGDAGAANHVGPLLAPIEPAERELAKRLLGFADAVSSSLETYSPHKMCGYLFELATTFTGFYENCPVLGAPDPRTRASRLALCALTAAVLEKGLDLLGIGAPERM
jgi:arginyl-tRNA synthetase